MVNTEKTIHGWFGLTYANYLVMPRSVLQSMPDEWQAEFVKLLNECREEFEHLDWPHYHVQALRREREYILESLCEECGGSGIDEEDEEEECENCDGSGYFDEDRYETAEEVGFRTDPIPPYDRGRTKLEAKSDTEDSG